MNNSLNNKPQLRTAFIITITLLVISIIMNLFFKRVIYRQGKAKEDLIGRCEILSTGLKNLWQIRETKTIDKLQKYYIMRANSASFEEAPATMLRSKICLVVSLRFCNDCIKEVVKELNAYYKNSGKDVLIIAHESEVNDISKLLFRHGSVIPIMSVKAELIKGLDESKIHFPYLFFVDEGLNVMHFMVLDKESVLLLKKYLYYKMEGSEYM